jgi:hypothetical protein
MRTTIIFLLLTLLIGPSKGQGFILDIHGGPGFSHFVIRNNEQLKKPVLAFTECINTTYQFKKVVGITTGVNFIRGGFSFVGRGPNSRFGISYLQIPLLLQLRSKGKLSLISNIGICYEYALRARYFGEYGDKIDFSKNVLNNTVSINRHAASVLASIGINYKATSHLGIFITAQDVFQLTNYEKKQEVPTPFSVTDPHARFNTFTVNLVFSYKL